MDDLTKRRGRPSKPDGQRAEPVTVRLPSHLHDRACREAIKHGVSVSSVLRVALARMVHASE